MPYHRRVLAFIDGLHVTGVRAAGDDSKVLMNDRVYHLLFADENNKVYTKALQ